MGLFNFGKKPDDETLSFPQNAVETWCRDTYALWAQANCDGWLYIGGCKRDKQAKADMRHILLRDWGIRNGIECLSMVETLGQLPIDGTPEAKAACAWDLCRAPQILGMAYVAGMIERKLLNEKSVVVGLLMQQAFSSWDDLLTSYLAGYADWATSALGENAPAQIRERNEICEMLKALPDGPYRQPWNLPLQM